MALWKRVPLGTRRAGQPYRLGASLLASSDLKKTWGSWGRISGTGIPSAARGPKELTLYKPGTLEQELSPLDLAPVQPLRLDCCVQSCCPHFKREGDKLGRGQRRATGTIQGIGNRPESERLPELNLVRVTKRRRRGALIPTRSPYTGHKYLTTGSLIQHRAA